MVHFRDSQETSVARTQPARQLSRVWWTAVEDMTGSVGLVLTQWKTLDGIGFEDLYGTFEGMRPCAETGFQEQDETKR